MRPPLRQDLEGAAHRRAGPGRREATQLARLIVEVDTVLAPSRAPFQQLEGTPAPGMKRMGDAENPLLTDRIACS
jgi:hypothetical protein